MPAWTQRPTAARAPIEGGSRNADAQNHAQNWLPRRKSARVWYRIRAYILDSKSNTSSVYSVRDAATLTRQIRRGSRLAQISDAPHTFSTLARARSVLCDQHSFFYTPSQHLFLASLTVTLLRFYSRIALLVDTVRCIGTLGNTLLVCTVDCTSGSTVSSKNKKLVRCSLYHALPSDRVGVAIPSLL